ncbi:hypothetical protein B0T10DRAFT_130604 [Thelonectria olida]|uniref:Arrestin-like N-terminal domain-containing protein n=1 Tax=Thelonectria olida TaxID=1576542 RepID=A0A9P8VXJ4_9HYPO|nr:hypothetical protein B0T10DRAFT_130604 [Thelonectria olida]
MPRTTPASSTNLGIRLESIQYAPGDTIIGCVYRKGHIVSPKASVTISLHGRTKSKMVVSRGGNSSSTYRGRFNVLGGPDGTQKVFDGPLHIPAGGEEQVWPFALALPTHVENIGLGVHVPKDHSYLPLDPEVVATHELPETFAIHHHGFSTNMEGFVEYFLRAEMRAMGHSSTGGMHEATLPFTLRALSSEPPIVDSRLRKIKTSYSITSYRLVPGMEEAELSLSQKTRQFFSSSKVPTLYFNYQIDTPTVIQLENPNAVPFIIRCSPDWGRTSEIINGLEQQARLKSLSLRIASATVVRCEGSFSPHDADTDDKLDLYIDHAIHALGEPIYIPITDDMPPVDIGELINLRIGYQGRVGPKFRQGTLHPSFTTYNIRHMHQLKWAICAEIAGEDFKASGSHPLTLLKPSDDSVPRKTTLIDGPSQVPVSLGEVSSEPWMRPPEDDPAPPSFTQVQKEDAMQAVAEVGDMKKAPQFP